MVEFVDGSVIAQLGPADMRLPIQHVFLLPERRPSRVAALEWSTLRTLTFEPPDLERFPCLAYAFEAARAGGTAPCVLNAANEIAVAAHLEGRISCGQIPRLIRRVLDAHTPAPAPGLAALRETDAWARRTAADLLAAEPAL